MKEIVLHEEINANCTDQCDQSLYGKYKDNIVTFISNNLVALYKAHSMRKNFSLTLKANVRKKDFHKEIADVKFLILTANEVERETLFSCCTNYPKNVALAERNIIRRIPYDGLVYSVFYINDIKVVHVEPEMTGSHTKGGTAETLRKALKAVRPTFVISVGVAFGYDIKKQQLCDVLVGRQFFSYDKSTKVKDDEINIKRLHVFEADQALLTKIKSTVAFEDKMVGLFENGFQAHIGNMITGEYVVDSLAFKNLITEPFKPFGIIGGEMEALGMFSVIDEYNKKKFCRKTRGIMIKGICDWAVGKNIAIKDSDLKIKIQGCPLDNNYCDEKCVLTSEDYKNNLQTLAMCNACTVCKSFLASNNLFSDYCNQGIIKGIYRFFIRLGRPFQKKKQDIKTIV